MQDQSQKNEMRAALRGDRERMLARWREEGRAPVFVTAEGADPEPGPEAAAPPLGAEVVFEPELEPEAEVAVESEVVGELEVVAEAEALPGPEVASGAEVVSEPPAVEEPEPVPEPEPEAASEPPPERAPGLLERLRRLVGKRQRSAE